MSGGVIDLEKLRLALRRMSRGSLLIVAERAIEILPRAKLGTLMGNMVRFDELTARELDVLRLMARGASNQEIAGELFISEGTVKTHIGHILVKLGLRDRSAAIVFAFDHGLAGPAKSGER